jgi:hypothetical protein
VLSWLPSWLRSAVETVLCVGIVFYVVRSYWRTSLKVRVARKRQLYRFSCRSEGILNEKQGYYRVPKATEAHANFWQMLFQCRAKGTDVIYRPTKEEESGAPDVFGYSYHDDIGWLWELPMRRLDGPRWEVQAWDGSGWHPLPCGEETLARLEVAYQIFIHQFRPFDGDEQQIIERFPNLVAPFIMLKGGKFVPVTNDYPKALNEALHRRMPP